jgi:serine/threonine protein kinase
MWTYQDKEFTSEMIGSYIGFVYLITNLSNGKKYIGKKSFQSKRKNKRTKRRETKESDWKNYYSSSEDLKKDVEILGKDRFKREILHLCSYKKQMTFLEEKEQWDRNVLLTDDYYNTNIGGKFFVRERHIYQARYKEITTKNDKWREIKSERMRGDNNIAKRLDIRNKISEKNSGERHRQFGKPLSEDHKRKLHEAAQKARIQRWSVVFPDGHIEIIENMKAFCREHNLNPTGMSLVANGHQNTHKGYKCQLVVESQENS